MSRDIKEIVGTLMWVLDGAEISREDVVDLGFDAEGELGLALNETHIQLLEFVYDRELRLSNPGTDAAIRSASRDSVARIVAICDRERISTGVF